MMKGHFESFSDVCPNMWISTFGHSNTQVVSSAQQLDISTEDSLAEKQKAQSQVLCLH